MSQGYATARRMALASADDLLRAKGRSFHWARHLLSVVHAKRATRLYGFCRHVDDLADEATSVVAARSALHVLSQAIASGQSTDPVTVDILELMRECDINPVIMLELIKGVASDLGMVRVPDDAALLRYCYRVAGTVGLMMCKILDVQDEAALRHAVDLGIAMQLTNICRDVREDALAGRRYLPASRVGTLAPCELITPSAALQPILQRCVAALLDRADLYYHSGEQGLWYLPSRARSAILVAGRVYQAIGTGLRRTDCVVWQARMVVPAWTKAVLTVRALLELRLQRVFPASPLPHEAALHAVFADLPYAQTRPRQ